MQSLLKLISQPFYRNSLSIITNAFFGTFFGLVFWIVAANMILAGEVGLAVATISAATLLTSLSRLGMDDVLVRFLPRTQDRSGLYGSILLVTLLLSLIFTGAFLCLIEHLSPSLAFLRDGWYLPLFVFYMATVSVFTTQNVTLLATRQADSSLVLNSLLGSRIPLLLLIGTMGAVGIFLSYSLAYLAALLLGFVYLLKQGFELRRPDLRSVIKTVRGHFGYSAGNYLAVIFSMLPSTVLPILIMNASGPENVAYFFIAYSIATILFVIPNAVSMSLFIEGSHDMPLKTYTYKSFRLILVIVVPLVFALFFFGDRLLLLFNREYSEQSIGLLKLLVIAGLFSPFISVFSSIRRVQKKIRSLNIVNAATSVLIIGLGYLFMTIYGLIGLGYAWIVAYAVMSVILAAILLREGKIFRAP